MGGGWPRGRLGAGMEAIGLIVLLFWLFRRKSGGSQTHGLARVVSICVIRYFVTVALFALPVLAPPIFILIWAVSLVLGTLTWFPTLVLEWIIVPLRMPKAAYWIARTFFPLGFASEAIAGGVVYGAFALARKKPSAKDIDWLRRRLDRVQKLEGGGLLAAGLLAAVRGGRHQARCLLFIADSMPPRGISRKARSVTRDWLVADAARTGQWREVIRLGRRRKQTLRWSYFMARLAERLVQSELGCSNGVLWLLWLWSPRRRATFPLLRRALATRRTPGQLAQSASADLPHALGDLARTFKNSEIESSGRLASSIRAIDAALDAPDTRGAIERRLVALGATHDVEGVVASFREQLIQRLAMLFELSPHLASHEIQVPAAEAAIARVRSRLFRDIKARCEDYDGRKRAQTALDASAEWETWAALRNAAERLVQLDPSSEATLFEAMWRACNNFAVFQHNHCKRRTLAHEMYSWLHQHAQSDPSALQLLAKNMRAALS
jgi:hypothetical protein